jgi:hypothetical protein
MQRSPLRELSKYKTTLWGRQDKGNRQLYLSTTITYCTQQSAQWQKLRNFSNTSEYHKPVKNIIRAAREAITPPLSEILSAKERELYKMQEYSSPTQMGMPPTTAKKSP